jgi:hypothetical protein
LPYYFELIIISLNWLAVISCGKPKSFIIFGKLLLDKNTSPVDLLRKTPITVDGG